MGSRQVLQGLHNIEGEQSKAKCFSIGLLIAQSRQLWEQRNGGKGSSSSTY